MEKALELGCDFVATGHYSRKESIMADGKPIYRLLAGLDKNKDQSYFLCQLSQKQLEKSLFPIGGLTKPEVRKIAEINNLVTATRKDSQGVCFVGKIDLHVFLQQKINPCTGKIVEILADWNGYAYLNNYLVNNAEIDVESLTMLTSHAKYEPHHGKVIGSHNGAWFYTIGQRKGLNIGGRENPLFVIAIDTGNNLIYVGQGENHPGLNRKGLFIKKSDIHWIRPALAIKAGDNQEMLVRIRYRQALQKARLFMKDEGLYILFNDLQRGIAPGQFAAWYQGEELLGSGVID